MKYNKQPISIIEQISQLKSRGLIIDNEDFAKKTLSIISYFRFANYLRPYEADKTIYWVNNIQPDNSVKSKVVDLLRNHPIVDTAAMGFPSGWEKSALWRDVFA